MAESNKQEKKNLVKDNPIDKRAARVAKRTAKKTARVSKRTVKKVVREVKKSTAKKVVAKKVSARKANKQYKREEVAKTKNRSKKYDITGKEARLRVRKVKAGVKAESKNNSAKKTDRLLAKEEKIGKKLREVRKKKK
jgi:hypothetical protein